MAQGYLSDEAVLAQAVNAANAAVGEMRTVHSKVNMLSPKSPSSTRRGPATC